MNELSNGTVKDDATHDLQAPEVKVSYFYPSFPGESQPKIAFTVNRGETVPSFTFEFRIGILLRNIDGELRIAIDMGDGNFFADYRITPEKLALTNGWSATELIIPNVITNVLPQQIGNYFLHIYVEGNELASADATLFIVEGDSNVQ
ncbi:hypothetical protein EFL64_04930 [Weissella cibaria]|uniref:hypothetical protein n=1 Tax=Weissella cibaria TaxID=137591 RepID=UPI00223B0C04|nr:hypothetical protein [Weissella cibaria]MCT0957174.1 hypothetical protein [Weissella cibaria]